MPMWEYHLTLDVGLDDRGGYLGYVKLGDMTDGSEQTATLHGETPDEVENMAHSWWCTHLLGPTPPSAAGANGPAEKYVF